VYFDNAKQHADDQKRFYTVDWATSCLKNTTQRYPKRSLRHH